MTRGFRRLSFAVILSALAPLHALGAVTGGADGIVAPRPNTAGPGDRYSTPSMNLTKVANALSIRTYSLSVVVTVPGGLGLTKPVSVTVDYASQYFSTGARGNYHEGRGLGLVLNDQEWDGTAREGQIGVRLWEAPLDTISKTPIARFVFPVPLRVKVDPLYDASLQPIQVTRIQDCAMLTSADVGVRWFSPDNQQHETTFRFGANKTVLVAGSQWNAPAVSSSRNYRMPAVGLYGIHIPSAPSNDNLIPPPMGIRGPMPVQEIKFQLNEPKRGCIAQVQYVIARKLKRYVDPSNPAPAKQEGLRAK